jgi:hypothetical protein
VTRAPGAKHWRFTLALALWGLLACHDDYQVGATQVTARIYIADEVRKQMSQLRVRSYRDIQGRYMMRAERSYPVAKLSEVVDVGFVPDEASGSEESGRAILVVADALSDKDEVLVEARASFFFVEHEQRLFELWLYPCGSMALGVLCSESECAEDSCQTCVRDHCAATPLYTKPQLVTLDPALAVDPSKPPPGHRTSDDQVDASQLDASVPSDASPLGSAAALDACADGSGARCGSGALEGGSPADAGTVLSDAALDAASDAAGFDAGARDASEAGPSDATTEASTDAQEPPGRCAQASAWVSAEANALIPALARSLAQHTTAAGTLTQYLCRMLTPDGVTLTPGKVSGSATNAGHFDFGCYSVFYGPVSGASSSLAWQSFGVDTPGAQFQVLTLPSECQLDWVAMTAGQALPTRALAVGNTGGANPAPIYACRINIQDAMTSGTHMGRLGNAPGDLCHVQYYQQPPVERSQFEVLVQTRP